MFSWTHSRKYLSASSKCLSLERALELGWTTVLHTDDQVAFQKCHQFMLPLATHGDVPPANAGIFILFAYYVRGMRNKALFTILSRLSVSDKWPPSKTQIGNWVIHERPEQPAGQRSYWQFNKNMIKWPRPPSALVPPNPPSSFVTRA